MVVWQSSRSSLVLVFSSLLLLRFSNAITVRSLKPHLIPRKSKHLPWLPPASSNLDLPRWLGLWDVGNTGLSPLWKVLEWELTKHRYSICQH
jgi:hypothetical protein